MVEFAMMAAVAMVILAVAAQYAIIGDIAISLRQMNYQGARYASANESVGSAAVKTYMLSVGAGVFNNNSSNLNVSMSPTASRSLGTQLTVTSTFTVPNSVIVLPNPFMGIVTFPTQLSSTMVMSSD
jgi:hypothetical protein